MKILIADDSAVSRQLLEIPLRESGHEVISVADGNEAMRILEGPDPPPIALLDWVMPGLSGIEITHKVRDPGFLGGYVHIILVTSKYRKEDQYEAILSGVDGYLIKPFDRFELLLRVLAAQRLSNLISSKI